MSRIDDIPRWKKLYKAAQKADDRFQAALVKEYGSRAGDMRYRNDKQTPAIRKLGAAYQKKSIELSKMNEYYRTHTENPKRYIQRPQDQRRAGVMAGRSGDYKTGAQAWADYYKYLFENFGRKTFLAGFKSGKSEKERVNPRGTGNTGITLPAHVRINPRTGKTQVFVTPKVAEKLRGVKGLRVAGNNPTRVEKPNRRWVLMGLSRKADKWVNLKFSNTYPPLEKVWDKLQHSSVRGTHHTYSDFKIEARNL